MANKYYDFDQFISEKESEYITVKILDKEYTVQKEIPALLPVLMARHEGSIDQQEQSRLLLRAADMLFGEGAVDEMCKKGLSTKSLIKIIEKLFKLIGANDDDDSEELDDESGKKAVGKPGKK